LNRHLLLVLRVAPLAFLLLAVFLRVQHREFGEVDQVLSPSRKKHEITTRECTK
jgi:hypothetical protein